MLWHFFSSVIIQLTIVWIMTKYLTWNDHVHTHIEWIWFSQRFNSLWLSDAMWCQNILANICSACNGLLLLTHRPLMPHICISESVQHWFRKWLVAYSVPSHYLNQYWFIVNWTPRNKHQWSFNQNTKLFIHQNASENLACEMAAILSRGRWVKVLYHCLNQCWFIDNWISRNKIQWNFNYN